MQRAEKFSGVVPSSTEAVTVPEVQAKIRQLGFEPNPSTPAEFAKLIKDEAAQWKGLADKGLLKP